MSDDCRDFQPTEPKLPRDVMKNYLPKPKFPPWVEDLLRVVEKDWQERVEMSAISPLQMAGLRSRRAKARAQRDEDYQFFKNRHWSKDQKEQILKAREERRMTEIRISPHGGWLCEFPVTEGSYCNEPARQWKLGMNSLAHLCKEHGEQIIELFSIRNTRHGLTITGGYDEPKPKSNLENIRRRLADNRHLIEPNVAYVLEEIVYLLAEKEQSDDSS